MELLSKDPSFCTCPEAEVLVNYFLSNPNRPFKLNDEMLFLIFSWVDFDIKLKSWGLDKLLLKRLLKHAQDFYGAFIVFLECYRMQYFPSATTVVFKATKISESLFGLLNYESFKSIQAIRIVRDPRAVFSSQRKTVSPTSLKIMNRNPIEVAYSWSVWMDDTDKILGPRFVSLNYEKLLLEGVDYLVVGLKQMKMEYSPYQPGNHFLRLPKEQRSIHKNVSGPCLVNRISDWQNNLSLGQIGLIEHISKFQMNKNGYDRFGRHNVWLRFTILYCFWGCLSRLKRIKKEVFG